MEEPLMRYAIQREEKKQDVPRCFRILETSLNWMKSWELDKGRNALRSFGS